MGGFIEMKLSHDIPPIYEKCHEVFGVNWSKGIIMTYGDTVYCKFDLGPDKIVHEETHIKQQTDMDKDIWWDKYFIDKEFRLSQEVAAYKNEAKFIKKAVKDKNLQARLIHQICLDLSSYIYGNLCTYSEARKLVVG